MWLLRDISGLGSSPFGVSNGLTKLNALKAHATSPARSNFQLWRCWIRDSRDFITLSQQWRKILNKSRQDRDMSREYLLMSFNCTCNLYLFDIPYFSRNTRKKALPYALVQIYVPSFFTLSSLRDIFRKITALTGREFIFLKTNLDVTISTYVMPFFIPFHIWPHIYYRDNKISFPPTQRRSLESFTEREIFPQIFAWHRSVFLWNGR